MKIKTSYQVANETIVEFTLNGQPLLASVQTLLGEQVVRCYQQDGQGNVTDITNVLVPDHVRTTLLQCAAPTIH